MLINSKAHLHLLNMDQNSNLLHNFLLYCYSKNCEKEDYSIKSLKVLKKKAKDYKLTMFCYDKFE